MGIWMVGGGVNGTAAPTTGVLSGPAAFLYEGAQVLGLQ